MINKARIKQLEGKVIPIEFEQPILMLIYTKEGKRYFKDVKGIEKEYVEDEWKDRQGKYQPIMVFYD